MGKLRWLRLLMGLTILGVTGFQLYWLKQSYEREKKSLEIKTDVAFKETLFQLQASKINLDWTGADSTRPLPEKVLVTNTGPGNEKVRIRVNPKNEIVSTFNVIRDKLKDSLKKSANKKGMVISLNQTSFTYRNDSMKIDKTLQVDHRPGDIVRLIYGVDSLQDSIRLKEIEAAYTPALESQQIKVPYTVLRLDSLAEDEEENDINQVTIGFSKPVTYRLQLGNTVPYLLKKISLPIIFSVILLGITLLSFVLLYRNLVKQHRLAALKNEFISNITHELKTPIATVGVAIEALKNFSAIQDPQRTREYLDISSNELQRLNLLVDKVLKLSMFEKKEMELKQEPLNLGDLVEEVTASMRLQLEKYHATVSFNRSGETAVLGDKLHLQSVVFNLLDNALKYGSENPRIEIDLQEKEEQVVLEVKDNGIGIPAEYKEKVFDKFFRVPHGDTHNAKGYGLGLSYVAQVVRKHNGTIEVDSEPGQGTRFRIILPKAIT